MRPRCPTPPAGDIMMRKKKAGKHEKKIFRF
jgi:hypothetical protein